MTKRGQATVFVILGIVILALFGLLLYLRGDLVSIISGGERTERFTSPDIEPVKDVVGECVELTLLDAVEYVSNRGGYFDPIDSSSYSRDANGVLVAYAWRYDFGTRLPSLQGLGKQLNLYMSDKRDEIETCIDERIGSYEQSWDIKNLKQFVLQTPQVSENSIKQKIVYPSDKLLSIQKGDYTATSSEIIAELDVALGQAQRMAADVSGCFNGDFVSLSSDFNTFCNVGSVPFRAEVYNMRYHQNVVRLLHQACSPDCDDCYILKIPSPRGDLLFNVALRTC